MKSALSPFKESVKPCLFVPFFFVSSRRLIGFPKTTYALPSSDEVARIKKRGKEDLLFSPNTHTHTQKKRERAKKKKGWSQVSRCGNDTCL